jgi:hypothetical protein
MTLGLGIGKSRGAKSHSGKAGIETVDISGGTMVAWQRTVAEKEWNSMGNEAFQQMKACSGRTWRKRDVSDST